MESQSVFQAETQAKIVSIESPPCVVRPWDREGRRLPVAPRLGVRVDLHEVDRAGGEPARLHQALVAVVVPADAVAPFIGDGPLGPRADCDEGLGIG